MRKYLKHKSVITLIFHYYVSFPIFSIWQMKPKHDCLVSLFLFNFIWNISWTDGCYNWIIISVYFNLYTCSIKQWMTGSGVYHTVFLICCIKSVNIDVMHTWFMFVLKSLLDAIYIFLKTQIKLELWDSFTKFS